MTSDAKARLLALAQKWRNEAEEFNLKFRDKDPHGAQICVATLEGCAEELEKMARELSP